MVAVAVGALLVTFGAEAQSPPFYVLDGFGGVHAGNGAPVISPPSTYFGFDIAESIAVLPSGTGYFVLDGFGGVHAGGGALVTGPVPFFGWDIARDLSLIPGGASSSAWTVVDGANQPVGEFLAITPSFSPDLTGVPVATAAVLYAGGAVVVEIQASDFVKRRVWFASGGCTGAGHVQGLGNVPSLEGYVGGDNNLYVAVGNPAGITPGSTLQPDGTCSPGGLAGLYSQAVVAYNFDHFNPPFNVVQQ
ncbi:MAG: hypothetical protein GY898_23115 [Proteobacteria bacterium]|nr:hypothetical protein [Pseudomonadota bacterium]